MIKHSMWYRKQIYLTQEDMCNLYSIYACVFRLNEHKSTPTETYINSNNPSSYDTLFYFTYDQH